MATENEPSRHETEERFVRSEDPQLSPAANAALTHEARRAVGTERVRMPAGSDDPGHTSRAGDSPAKATAMSLRPVFIVTLAAGLTIGAIISLATGSWWALIAAAAVHAIGTIVVASGAIQLATQTEHASPQTTALLEDEGVADPDRVLSDLVEDYTPGPGRFVIVGASVVAGVVLFLALMGLVTEWGS